MKQIVFLLFFTFSFLSFSNCTKEEVNSKYLVKWVSGMPVFVKSKKKVSEIAEAEAEKRRKIPGFFEQALVENDKRITNTTGLKVFMLFNSNNKKFKIRDMGESLFCTPEVYEKKNPIISYEPFNFVIMPDGIICFFQYKFRRKNTIQSFNFYTNYEVKPNEKGEYIVYEDLGKKPYNTDLGKLVVNSKRMYCQDTGKNPFVLYHDGGTLSFEGIGNLSFFEYDTYGNGKKDLYICNQFDCEGFLEIFKISDQ